MVEADLIRRCRAGESACYEPLVRSYEGAALRMAIAMLGDPDDARDAVQDAFVKAYTSLSRFDEARQFAPWFYRILRNRCRDMLRGRRPTAQLTVLDHRPEGVDTRIESRPDRLAEREAAQSRLWRALNRISADHREVLVLKELQGLRYAEIAEVMGVPEGTIASRLFHARKALRAALTEDEAHMHAEAER